MKAFQGVQAFRAVAVVAAVFCIGWAMFAVSEMQTQQAALATFVTEQVSPAASPVVAARERIFVLPEDGKAYHVSVCVHDDWQRRPNERELLAWWKVDTRLASLAAQAHFHTYTESDPIFKTNIAPALPQLPAVLVQDETGKVHFKASGENLPGSATELGDAAVSAFWKAPYLLPYRRNHTRPCPCPLPSPAPPAPGPNINVDVGPRPIPDTAPLGKTTAFPWGLALASCAVAGAAVLLLHFAKPGGLK